KPTRITARASIPIPTRTLPIALLDPPRRGRAWYATALTNGGGEVAGGSGASARGSSRVSVVLASRGSIGSETTSGAASSASGSGSVASVFLLAKLSGLPARREGVH